MGIPHIEEGDEQPQSGGGGGPYDGVNQPRGFFPALRSLLYADQFWFDSADNIVNDSVLKNFLLANSCHYLHRLTAASPIDTLSITRDGDTIGCNHADWMILQMDSVVDPLLLTGLLMAEFPRDIIEAFPDYRGPSFWDVCPNSNWECQVSDTMINTPLAWDHEVGDTNIIVAHYDVGFDYRHPGFLNTVVGTGHKIVFSWDYDAHHDQAETYRGKTTDHGTGCMAMIGLPTNRGDYHYRGRCRRCGTAARRNRHD